MPGPWEGVEGHTHGGPNGRCEAHRAIRVALQGTTCYVPHLDCLCAPSEFNYAWHAYALSSDSVE